MDRVWLAITTGLLGHPTRSMPSGWINFNCPMCVTRGESQDTKHRCGVINSGRISVKCFNCGFRAGFQYGLPLSRNMKALLRNLGMSPKEITRLAYWADQMRRQAIDDGEVERAETPLNFPTIDLPADTLPLNHWIDTGCSDANFLATVEYLASRGEDIAAASVYYWSPRWHNRRLVIPCYHDGRLIGWTARAIDQVKPRYLKQLPANYLFNTQFLGGARHYVFIVEGVFDALAIDAVAALGSTLNERQIAWINRCGKQPVVVPDRDRAGERLVKVALDQGWPVATPNFGRHQWWAADIKDAAEAVRRYRKPYVMQSILATLETDVGKIQQRVKYYAR